MYQTTIPEYSLPGDRGLSYSFLIGKGAYYRVSETGGIRATVPIVCLTEITSISERCSVVPLREPHASVDGSYS